MFGIFKKKNKDDNSYQVLIEVEELSFDSEISEIKSYTVEWATPKGWADEYIYNRKTFTTIEAAKSFKANIIKAAEFLKCKYKVKIINN